MKCCSNVPMEPFDFPDSDPGPHTLRSGVAEDANTEKLVWALTRFTGYTGVTNLLGGRLLSDADSLEPVLTYLTRRGLLFYDNGAATGDPFGLARCGEPRRRILRARDHDHRHDPDRDGDRPSAFRSGDRGARAWFASGSGSLYPVTLQRVAQWAQGLNGRGFVLVPVSAIVQPKR